ncbi:MAG: hypothetical protein OEY55_04970 [Acidimicrobiia bacterium]|nr:hypothetical protein [Acidimicrobiia bacterium]
METTVNLVVEWASLPPVRMAIHTSTVTMVTTTMVTVILTTDWPLVDY